MTREETYVDSNGNTILRVPIAYIKYANVAVGDLIYNNPYIGYSRVVDKFKPEYEVINIHYKGLIVKKPDYVEMKKL